ncbi:MAG: GGDEF domain-containing protein [Lachnospiraceae bacterium]|nr:GGDEF domain-containing protein [Lachnospiraceae bacterium]
MSFIGYLSEHWGLLVLLTGLTSILFSDTHLERKMLRRMGVVVVFLFIYSISCYIEAYFGNQTYYTVLRPLLSAFNYSLIVYILVNIILIMYPEHHFYFWIPSSINTVLCFISVKTGIVFYISKDNHFGRGTLGYLTYAVCIIYLFYFVYKVFNHIKSRAEDFTMPVFMVITSVLCIVMPLIFEEMALHWFNVTIAMEALFYYIYILQQYTKRDSLTNLLNRHSYYRDAEKYMNVLTGFIAMDMNGLKQINDQHGHLAGDLALQTLAECFWESAKKNHRIYRIGGDEFIILCINSTEDDIKQLISRIEDAIAQTQYSCSIGYAIKVADDTLDSLYHKADTKLYEAKRKYYETTGQDRRRQPR